MEFVNVFSAAVAAFAAGALYYVLLSDRWIAASGVPTGPDGRAANAANAAPFLIGFLCILLVAGMMRYLFAAAGIDTPRAGLLHGAGIGGFLIAPWIALNAVYAMHRPALAVIDGGYAVLGCAIIGLVLALF